ncbi:MAG: DUF255 domain-containing protein [Halobacteriaceae archaeon]
MRDRRSPVMDEAAVGTNVDWLPWGPRAFRAAAHLERPLLLAITAPWCRWCHRMDRGAYSDPGVAANINDGFVPVRVDADRQPRVRDRYATGGFPSTVFLTPAGTVIAAAGHLEADGLRSVLGTVRERWAAAGIDAGRVPRAIRDQSPPSGELDGQVERLLAGQLRSQWDDRHGGWGTAEKFPLPETVQFALKRESELAVQALDLITEHLQAADGAVYRHASRDWATPEQEVLTDTTGAVLETLAHAFCLTGAERFQRAAAEAVAALVGPFWTGRGVAASRGHPDDDDAPAPDGIDRTVLADRNAACATGLLWYHAYTGADQARTRAETIISTLVGLTRDGDLAHHDGPDAERGLLVDQGRALEAGVAAAQILGDGHLEWARSIADASLERLGTDAGPLVDGPPRGPGLLDRPLRPLDGNAVLANGLVSLATLTDEGHYHEAARELLGGFAGAADRIGVQAAVYGTAAARAVDSPLAVAVGGEAGTPLHRAALRVADHEKVVIPDADGPRGTAWLRLAGGRSREVDTPDALETLVREHAETS